MEKFSASVALCTHEKTVVRSSGVVESLAVWEAWRSWVVSTIITIIMIIIIITTTIIITATITTTKTHHCLTPPIRKTIIQHLDPTDTSRHIYDIKTTPPFWFGLHTAVIISTLLKFGGGGFSNFIPNLVWDYLSTMGLKWSHISKRGVASLFPFIHYLSHPHPHPHPTHPSPSFFLFISLSSLFNSLSPGA